MLTIEPIPTPSGRRIEGNSMRCALEPIRICARDANQQKGRMDCIETLTAIPASTKTVSVSFQRINKREIRGKSSAIYSTEPSPKVHVPNLPTVNVKLPLSALIVLVIPSVLW
jgi:hypothetical protein